MGLFKKKNRKVNIKDDRKTALLQVNLLPELIEPSFRKDYPYFISGAPYKYDINASGGEILYRLLNGKDTGCIPAYVRECKGWEGTTVLGIYAIDGHNLKWKIGLIDPEIKPERYERMRNMTKNKDAVLYIEAVANEEEPRFTRCWLHVAFK